MAPCAPDASIGIYIHIPFCHHICPYCDFNTYSGMGSLIPRYVDSVVAHIGATTAVGRERRVASIFIGGGTPSLVPADGIQSMIDACKRVFDVDRDAEVTIEANPNGIDGRYLTGLLEAGVNRLSIGAQTFDHRGLRVLGRQHEAADSVGCVQKARSAGIRNLSLDLIFGWPGQSLDVWQRDLESAIELQTEHLSLYNLIVEPGTPMAEAVDRKVLVPTDDDDAADMYQYAIDALESRGWVHYEIANWARGERLESRHNVLYWRNGEYIAFGAGAHGRVGDRRYMNHLAPRTYVDAIEAANSAVSNEEVIEPKTSISETMMLGLRLLEEGIAFDDFSARHRCDLDELFELEIESLQSQSLLVRDNERLRLTKRGTMLANDVCARFL